MRLYAFAVSIFIQKKNRPFLFAMDNIPFLCSTVITHNKKKFNKRSDDHKVTLFRYVLYKLREFIIMCPATTALDKLKPQLYFYFLQFFN